ncbi:MAG: glycoside hydrolase family 3 protein, partial [Clostridia bacterium]|nr:glycoside hydrolase family 3 protein [Clostridia bacterium]
MKHLPKYIVIGILVLLCLVYLFSRCSIFAPAETEEPAKKPEKVSITASDKVKGILEDMTLEEKLYQMFYVTPEQLTETEDVIFAGETTKKAVDEKNVGGIVYAEKNLQDRTQAKELLKNTQSFAKIPMFLGTTEEGGQKFSISRNSQMSLGEIEPMGQVSDADSAYAIGEKIGEALKELGLNMNFAPVADVMAEDKFNMIGDRSFGYDKDEVSRKVEWIIKGLKKGGVAVTLKHFP